MPYAVIENSGVCAYQGKIQVRMSMFLNPSDARYNECHVTVPDTTGQVYSGPVDGQGNPSDPSDFQAWLETLPTKAIDVPFNNHFEYVTVGANALSLINLMKARLAGFYAVWAGNQPIETGYTPVPFKAGNGTLAQCNATVNTITSQTPSGQ